MAATALTDVTLRMRRPLTAEEALLAAALLDVAEARVRLRLGSDTVTERLSVEPDYAQSFRGVVADAVCRVLRNPEGYRQESVGPFSWTFDVGMASGMLDITTAEWGLLEPEDAQNGAFSVDTALPPPGGALVGALWPFDPVRSPGYWGTLS